MLNIRRAHIDFYGSSNRLSYDLNCQDSHPINKLDLGIHHVRTTGIFAALLFYWPCFFRFPSQPATFHLAMWCSLFLMLHAFIFIPILFEISQHLWIFCIVLSCHYVVLRYESTIRDAGRNSRYTYNIYIVNFYILPFELCNKVVRNHLYS